MRSETDTLYSESEESSAFAERDGDKIAIFVSEEWSDASIALTKQQAREFARQLLEMCGDE
jgi:hypothetical protein